MMTIAELRKEYTREGLRRADLEIDPIMQFRKWFEQALKSEVLETNAMTLSTVDSQMQPSSRIVLLKAVDERGFSFFTNYESRKGQELAVNNRAALNFFWAPLERQVCIRGRCELLPRSDSEAYFKVRPLASRIGAWVSKQSSVVTCREFLETRFSELQTQYGENVPLPPYWGGYLLCPEAIEFWQGRPSRLHDRFLYTRSSGDWRIDRLSP
ncbi:MAG: pyridoxamine 5'-phosphate oxidase [Verrucomicrobiota bacterium]|nr:pyridoxamine 5'-phosphate oxidase [Verrucomicrobiota bacterium]